MPTTIIETAKTHMKEDPAILMAISANQNGTGLLPSVPCHEATTRKKSFAELQIIVPKINTTLDTTLASPSPKPKKS